MVDRQNLLQTAFNEISSLKGFNYKTLEVQFYDEVIFSVSVDLIRSVL